VDWEERDEAESRFMVTLGCLNSLVRQPAANPLYKTRIRNQADFYSLFTAMADLLHEQRMTCEDPILPHRLSQFIPLVEDEVKRLDSHDALDYFTAARSNSNDTGPRIIRTDIIKRVLLG
jgi:hypothetical protein